MKRFAFALLLLGLLVGGNSLSAQGYTRTFLPFITTAALVPDPPSLNPIDNSDQNRTYTVTWQATPLAETYVLEQALAADFSDAHVAYSGPGLQWSSDLKFPGTFYYRVRAQGATGSSQWGPTRSVTIYPIFVGLQLRWDGEGYIRTDEAFDVGIHQTRNFQAMTDANAIRMDGVLSYNPNPEGWPSDVWTDYYNVRTGYWLSGSDPEDPAWKWGAYKLLPYDVQYVSGQTATIDGQPFSVTGPHAGYTAFGQAYAYWELKNLQNFLYWDAGGAWTQRVHPGELILRYDAGNTRLMTYRNTLRRYYYNGTLRPYTVQYIEYLTAATSFPGSGAVEFASSVPGPESGGASETVAPAMKNRAAP